MILSIITINLNNGEGLNNTIQSVIKFAREAEFIVIDGLSTDNSQSIIKQHQNFIDYFLIEKDKGIYDAMNKGINICNGLYLLFLNSGDVLIDYIDYDCFNQGQRDFIFYTTDLGNGYSKAVKQPVIDFIKILSPPHQSSFIKRSLFLRWGFYNTGYKIVGDLEWFCRVLTLGHAECMVIPKTLVLMQINGVSSVDNCSLMLERDWVRFKYFNDLAFLKTLRNCWRFWICRYKGDI
jgi:glycosyltransferase involved in cell wall biosynthesis